MPKLRVVNKQNGLYMKTYLTQSVNSGIILVILETCARLPKLFVLADSNTTKDIRHISSGFCRPGLSTPESHGYWLTVVPGTVGLRVGQGIGTRHVIELFKYDGSYSFSMRLEQMSLKRSINSWNIIFVKIRHKYFFTPKCLGFCGPSLTLTPRGRVRMCYIWTSQWMGSVSIQAWTFVGTGDNSIGTHSHMSSYSYIYHVVKAYMQKRKY